MTHPHKTDWLFPLVLMAFIGPAVKYINVLFNTSTRWAILLLLLGALFMVGKFFFTIQRSSAHLWINIYISWCILTVLWSQVPDLSFYKSMALLLVAITLISAGRIWVNIKAIDKTFNYLYPLLALTLLAGIAGQWATNSQDVVGRGVILYKGLTGNSNMFGSMVTMIMPLLLWKLYFYWNNFRRKLLWGSILALSFAFLLLAHSRAAILTALLACGGALFALHLKKQLVILMSASIFAIAIIVSTPNFISHFKTHYIYKSGSSEQGILFSRENKWSESYELAKEGGWIGAGYGVTIGDSHFVGGLTAFGYGREKGNSQLAIWEETGFIGLTLYSIMLILLLAKLFFAYKQTIDTKLKLQLAIIIGMQLGLLIQSFFEAWWVAPGSPEAAYFWALTGISLGLLDKAKYERIMINTYSQSHPIRYSPIS